MGRNSQKKKPKKALKLSRRVRLNFLLVLSSIIFLGSGLFYFLRITAAPPVVSEIIPYHGPIAGGTVITITGSGFKGEYERVEALVFDGDAYIQTDVRVSSSYINARFLMDPYNANQIPNVVFGTDGDTNTASFARYDSGAYRAYKTAASYYTIGSGITKENDRNDVTIDPSATIHVNGTQYSLAGSLANSAGYLRIGGSVVPSGNYYGMLYAMKLSIRVQS